MPGQTDNTTILAAENQEVVALNEIVTAIEEITVPPAQIELTLNTTGLETVISTLQTALVSALDTLRVVVNGLNFCCTTPTTTPPEPGTPGGGSPGDPPTPGQEEPEGTTEEKASRRCKIAMWLVDDYLNGVVEWGDKSYIDDWINGIVATGVAASLTTITAIAGACVAAVLSQFITPGPTPDDVLTTFLGGAIAAYIAYALTSGSSLDFAALKGFIDTNRVKMICALVNSQNSYSAHSALMAAIDDTSPGLDPGNRRFVDRMLSTAILALLFYVDEQFSVLEAWIAEQPDTCPCADVDPETGTPTNLYKCKAANYLFDNFVDSFNNWASIATMTWYSTPNFISALTGGLITTLMGPLYTVAIVGWNMLAKIVSFLGTIFWNGFDYFSAFELIAAEFETRKAEIICELYLAADVDTVRTELESRINDYVGTVMTAHPEWADQTDTYKDVLKALLPNTVINVLFETTPRDEITNYAPEDFTECVCGGEPDNCDKVRAMYNGGFKCTQVAPCTFESVLRTDVGDRYEVTFAINHANDTTFTDWVGPMMNLTMTVISGTVQFTSPPSPFRLFNQSSGAVYGSSSPPSSPVCCAWGIIVSTTPFTILIDLTTEC